MNEDITSAIKNSVDLILEKLNESELPEKINILNFVRKKLHDVSPFKDEPIDYVKWVSTDSVHANDYNPNSVAPPEMALLEHSIDHDGFTQPVVGWAGSDDKYEVVDGFHRTAVAKGSPCVRDRLHGFMPIVSIQDKNADRNDRVAATIRHNRARGKHKVESMSDIVVELKKRNWSDDRVAKELGMDADEVLRLCQVSGLVEVFSNEEFSMAWEASIYTEDEFAGITEDEIE
jgi:ParB-like chromosome segregation protein Spo0J